MVCWDLIANCHRWEKLWIWLQNGIESIVKYKIERWWSNWRVSAAVKEWQSFWNASTLKNNPLSMTLIKIQSIILLGSVNMSEQKLNIILSSIFINLLSWVMTQLKCREKCDIPSSKNNYQSTLDIWKTACS